MVKRKKKIIQDVTIARPLYLLTGEDGRLSNVKNNLTIFLDNVRNLFRKKSEKEENNTDRLLENEFLY